jgi:hypothetical protein
MEKPRYPKLPESKDRRVKIPKEEHETIRLMHKEGKAIRAIAREYQVDKRLIQFIIFPERLVAARANRDWRKYYNTEDRKDIMREHRQYKSAVQPDEYAKWKIDDRKRSNQIEKVKKNGGNG